MLVNERQKEKLKHSKFQMNMRKFFTVRVSELWKRILRDVAESPSLELLKSRLETNLSNVL